MLYREALLYASGIVILNALNAIFVNHIYFHAFHSGLQTRVAVCSLIYRKALRLSQTAIGQTSPGKMVNLLTNDVNRFDWALYFFHALWISPLLTIFVAYLVWFEIGLPGLIGIAVVFAVVPLLSEYFNAACASNIERNKIFFSFFLSVRLCWKTNFSISPTNRTKDG